MCLRKTGQYSSIWDCAGQLYRTHGWRVFYRGYVPNLLGILPYAGVDMALYETFKHLATNWNQPLSVKAESVGRTGDSGSTKLPLVPPVVISLCSGALSSVCGQVATYPLALVKTKLQAQSSITENVEKVVIYLNVYARLYYNHPGKRP
ncbi:unnamed protein product [Protopolystoma xenopodis]|uniref:Mitochondrial carrier protein n=1 Tax=Protopolystoma xenopodis TaxID=117903 RepID=A0A448WF27_9PLAT|nr:unnamed protein product [Protopolystoma xenopodis]